MILNPRFNSNQNNGSFNSLLPARLDAKMTAEVLGFNEHDIPVLVTLGLLEPLGKPAQNARKWYARAQITQIAEDPKWLNKATNTLYQYWQKKNANRGRGEFSEQVSVSA